MKALQLTAWNHDAELQEVPEPDPGPGEVVIRIGGAGACHSDLHLMHDFPPGAMPFSPPFTLGHENAGWVEALGAGVDGLAVGQPVAVYGPWGCGRCPRCMVGAENYCDHQGEIGVFGGGLGLNGGMAPLMLVPNSRWLIPLRNLDPVLAAPLTDAGLTPYHAIKRSLHLLVPGSTALVIGAGGLGHMAVQILRELTPATIVVVDQRPAALDRARDLGAHVVISAGPDAAAEIRDVSRGRGVDATIDLVGTDDTLALGAAVTRSLGHLSLVGLGGGTLPVGFFSPAYEVSVASTYWGTLPELVEVLELAESGRVHADIHRVGLADVADAYTQLREGSVTGRLVMVPGD